MSKCEGLNWPAIADRFGYGEDKLSVVDTAVRKGIDRTRFRMRCAFANVMVGRDDILGEPGIVYLGVPWSCRGSYDAAFARRLYEVVDQCLRSIVDGPTVQVRSVAEYLVFRRLFSEAQELMPEEYRKRWAIAMEGVHFGIGTSLWWWGVVCELTPDLWFEDISDLVPAEDEEVQLADTEF